MPRILNPMIIFIYCIDSVWNPLLALEAHALHLRNWLPKQDWKISYFDYKTFYQLSRLFEIYRKPEYSQYLLNTRRYTILGYIQKSNLLNQDLLRSIHTYRYSYIFKTKHRIIYYRENKLKLRALILDWDILSEIPLNLSPRFTGSRSTQGSPDHSALSQHTPKDTPVSSNAETNYIHSSYLYDYNWFSYRSFIRSLTQKICKFLLD